MKPARRWYTQLIPGTLLAVTVCHALAQPATNSLPPQFPPVPVARSPVDAFRELLALEPAALRNALTNRSEEARKRLVAKIQDYKKLDPDERELRLVATELRRTLMLLMQQPATNRTEQLAAMRDTLRPLVESRLARWDAQPGELREMFLQNESTLSLLLQLGPASADARRIMVAEVSPELRDTLNRALARLDAMSPAERRRAFEAFENASTMTAAEKVKVLRTMSDAEKKQMEKTLETFSLLTREQRKVCVQSYAKFAGMNAEQRALFMRNVKQWDNMTPKERQQWRELVKNVDMLPPLPEIKHKPPPMPPPMPPDPRPIVTTNKT